MLINKKNILGDSDLLISGEGAAMSKFKLAVLDDIAEKKVEDELLQLKQQEIDKTKSLLEVTGLPEGTQSIVLENAAKFSKPGLGESSSGIVRRKYTHSVTHSIQDMTHKYEVQPTAEVESVAPNHDTDVFKKNPLNQNISDCVSLNDDLLEICQDAVNLMNVAAYDFSQREIKNMEVTLKVHTMNDRISVYMKNITSDIESVDNLISLIDIFAVMYNIDVSVVEYITKYIKMKRDGLI